MTRADNRPRVHIWQDGATASWSKGPHGRRSRQCATVGEAIDDAGAVVDLRAGAVIIVEVAG